MVLSLFPGIGLLDRAFEEAGFCVVRGPDIIWGGDVHNFHPPAGRFDGVIGGPPCKRFSPLSNVVRAVHGEASLAPDLIPEFERIVAEAAPAWFLMENVERAPLPEVEGYRITTNLVSNRRCGGEQNRIRRFAFGSHTGVMLDVAVDHSEPDHYEPAVTGNNGGRRAKIAYDATGRIRGKQGSADHHRLARRPISRLAELQGLPSDFLAKSPLTVAGKREAIGNGVPLFMGRRVVDAIVRVIPFLTQSTTLGENP